MIIDTANECEDRIRKVRGGRRFPWVGTCLLASALAGCLGPVAGVFPPQKGEPTETVFVVNHGWHTGLVVESRKFVSKERPAWAAAAGNKYLEIGWGDEGFYRCEKVTTAMKLRAMFWRNPSVLHVVAINDEPEIYFPRSGVIKVEVTATGFKQLRDYLSSAYATDDRGRPIDLGKGIYGNSRFYRATGHYHFPNTCNKWTARALRATGAPISPFYAVRAENVFAQASKFGTVVRGFGKD